MRIIFQSILISLFSILVIHPVMADTEFLTQIETIDYGVNGQAEPLIFLTNGQVVKIQPLQKSQHEKISQAVFKKTWFKVKVDVNRFIIALDEVPAPQVSESLVFKHDAVSPFNPSILKSTDEARKYFFEAKINPRDSQCFNRAHVWTYEWRLNHNFYASKAWLFFTSKFIRKHNFGWWFHVAPMVHVVVDNAVKERVMDMKYARGPLKLKQWSDIFMKDNANCPVVEKYTDHANHPESGSCFIMKSSMYFYQPIDLELQELNGTDKDLWIPTEVRQAYLDALEVVLP